MNSHYISVHSVKSVQVRSFFWSVFFRIRTEYGDLLRKSLYSVRIRENKDQKKLRVWTFLRCGGDSQHLFVFKNEFLVRQLFWNFSNIWYVLLAKPTRKFFSDLIKKDYVAYSYEIDPDRKCWLKDTLKAFDDFKNKQKSVEVMFFDM